MLNISSIKKLPVLHKPSEIQWNITGTLPGKLKKKNLLGLILQNITPWNHITKMWEITILGGTLGPRHQFGIPWFFKILWISEKTLN